MKNKLAYIIIMMSGLIFAQIEQEDGPIHRNEDIRQGSVTVERVYEPKVDAAEKIKQTPQIEAIQDEKLPVTYATKDIEAVSDFETSTINAEELPVNDQSPYNNYIRAAYGNRASLLLDGYTEYLLDNNNSLGASLSYRATDGNIPDKITDTDEFRLQAETFYKINLDAAMADVRLGGSIHQFNLYGLNNPLASIDVRDVDHGYNNIYIQGKYTAFDHLYLDNVKVRAGFFADKHDANESSVDVNARFANEDAFSLNMANGLDFGASADVNLNFSSTQFDFSNPQDYNYLTLGIAPQLHYKNDKFGLKAGINLQYNSESEMDISDFYIFPHTEIFVTAVPEFGFYGGVTGGLTQNRYQTLSHTNPYLFSNQLLKTTINKLEFYAGIRGDIGQNFKYDAKARYQDLENIAFFQKGQTPNEGPFQFYNSFQAIYDDGKRSSVEGVIHYLGVQNLNLSAGLLFQMYDLDNLEEAFDKPGITATINADYKLLNDRLILGGDLFIVEQRKSSLNLTHVDAGNSIINLDAYVDLNANATYLITDRWSAYAEINNMLNNNYERFLDYQVQGFTALGGVMFKF